MTTRRQALKLLTSAAVGSVAGCSESKTMNEKQTESEPNWASEYPPDVEEFIGGQEELAGTLRMFGRNHVTPRMVWATAAYAQASYEEQQKQTELLAEIRDELKDGQA